RFVLKLGQSGPVAMWLSIVVGVAALLLAALTDHPTGLVRIIPYWLHLWVDRAVREIGVGTPRRFTGAKPRDGGQRCDIWSLRAPRHRSCPILWRFLRDGGRIGRPFHSECHRIGQDRKSTRLNSSHQIISYSVFCLKK